MAETAREEMISVKVNGEDHRLPAGSTIADMLRSIAIAPEKVAVERNREIVPRSTIGETQVSEGDSFEIVHFVGGG